MGPSKNGLSRVGPPLSIGRLNYNYSGTSFGLVVLVVVPVGPSDDEVLSAGGRRPWPEGTAGRSNWAIHSGDLSMGEP